MNKRKPLTKEELEKCKKDGRFKKIPTPKAVQNDNTRICRDWSAYIGDRWVPLPLDRQ